MRKEYDFSRARTNPHAPQLEEGGSVHRADANAGREAQMRDNDFSSNPKALPPERVALLMQLVGQCLLRYQRIEMALKVMLPHTARPGAGPKSDPPRWREYLDSKYTLGPLMEHLKKDLVSEEPDAIGSYLRDIVNERNDLVHHFLMSSSAFSGSADALDRAIAELERRLRNALPLERSLSGLVDEFARRIAPP